jgi:hypothetical protein
MNIRILLIGLTLTVSACKAVPTRVDLIPDPRLSSEYQELISSGGIVDFALDATIEFRPGLPKKHGALNSAVTYGAPRFEFLDTFLVVVMHTPPYKFDISGYADSEECVPELCQELSQIRADAVYQLLIKKGVPVSKLNAPVGYGASWPTKPNATEEYRQRARSVFISMAD